MRSEFVLRFDSRNDFTPDEPWTLVRDPTHHYANQADFAMERLPITGDGRCLVVGSPLFEVTELIGRGWDVTYVDVRVPPSLPGFGWTFCIGDAATLEFEPESFDAASSTCVLCHAGMGRYTDPKLEDADTRILANICRALKRGARAAITFGPVAPMSGVLRIGNTHRIYTPEEARKMTTGFHILEERILDADSLEWTNEPNGFRLGKTYLSMLLEKA